MYAEPLFRQGVFSYTGSGMDNPVPVGDGALKVVVPSAQYAQPTYFRAGNSSDKMIYLVLLRDGKPMRYFPLGAKSDSHVALAVIEDLGPGTVLDVVLAAPDGTNGYVVVDFGLVLTNHEY